MKRIFDFMKVRHANAWRRLWAINPAMRWRSIFMALALALIFGSAGQTPPAQAAPAGGTEIRFSMSARKLNVNATTCLGDDVPIDVRVTRAEFVGGQALAKNAQDLPGVTVEATMSNAGVGNLHPVSIYTGYDPNDPGGASFIFHADKVGSTTISFKGTINHIWWPAKLLGLGPIVDRKDFVNAQVEIKVEDCQYKVTAISRWSGFGLEYEAIIDEAGMTADAPGHYTGTATVTWTIYGSPGFPCQHINSSTSQADLTGDMDADGQQIVVDLAYQPVETTLVLLFLAGNCSVESDDLISYSPDPLTFSVPASGGSHKLSQALVDMFPSELNMSGSADVFVERVTSH